MNRYKCNGSSDITATDLFCGAGGSSTGLVNAGIRVVQASNHWELAIETHNTNHPDTEHDCADLRQTHPSLYPRTTMLWASPECTNHSLAKGRKRKSINQLDLWGNNKVDPAEERSRATMREIIEFTEYHQYEFVIVENVVDIRHWAHYNDWLFAMHNLGYHHKTLYLNSMFFGVPQSRDRWYTVFWKQGNPTPDLDFKPRARCDEHGLIEAVQAWKNPQKQWGRYGERRQYVYRCPECGGMVEPTTVPAGAVIDWSIPAPRIGDRKRPLKPKTIERIKKGLEKFSQTLIVETTYSGNTGNKARPADTPLPTQTTRQSLAIAVPPMLASVNYFDDRCMSLNEPLPTQTTANKIALVITPFLAIMKSSYPKNYILPPRSLDDPLTTIVSTASQHALVIPPFISYLRKDTQAISLDKPLNTITAGGGHAALIMAYYGNAPTWAKVSDPMPTQTSVQRHALIDPANLVEDCGFRMLEPHELKLGMSFPGEYIILGNKRQRVKQIGNAVTPNVAQWIAQRCVDSLA